VSLVPPGPGGRLPRSQIEPSREARKTCVVIMVHRDFMITLYKEVHVGAVGEQANENIERWIDLVM
jgi:hypothetical protein